MTGKLTTPSLSATTLSADTIYGNSSNPYYYKAGAGNLVEGINGVSVIDGTLKCVSLSSTTFMDFQTQTTLPNPAKGRLFFSGGTLNAMMYCSGNTDSDWVIMNAK